jgi:hypothetical protein
MQERGRSGTSALGLRGSRRVGYHYLAPSPRHLRSRRLALSTLSPTADIGLIEFAFLSIGLGFNTGPLLSVAVPTAPAHAGVAAGVVNTARMIGATLGVAVLGGIFAAHAGQNPVDPQRIVAGLQPAFVGGDQRNSWCGGGVAMDPLRSPLSPRARSACPSRFRPGTKWRQPSLIVTARSGCCGSTLDTDPPCCAAEVRKAAYNLRCMSFRSGLLEMRHARAAFPGAPPQLVPLAPGYNP